MKIKPLLAIAVITLISLKLFAQSKQGSVPVTLTAQEEIVKLRKENLRLKKENAIIKREWDKCVESYIEMFGFN